MGRGRISGFTVGEVSFYDASGKVVASGRDTIRSLKPKANWDFEVPAVASFDTFEVTRAIGF